MNDLRKYLIAPSFLTLSILCSSVAYANWFQDIIDAINAQGLITNGILKNETAVQRDILTCQRDIAKLVDRMNGNFSGHSGYGNYQFHNYQTYGKSASEWSAVMHMAATGFGGGDLGHMMASIAKEFPTQQQIYNAGIRNANNQCYYALKSQTILATRAASELDYNKIQDQISYQRMLQQQIEQTNDLKAAIDLLNRLQVESNLINLQILRQAALANQQYAVTELASVNSALLNAKFLKR